MPGCRTHARKAHAKTRKVRRLALSSGFATPGLSEVVGVVSQAERPRLKYAGRIDNIIFLDRVGETLCWATADTPKEALPEEMRLLLRRLNRLETRAALKAAKRP